eukprot:SAG25_NODE_866_length_5015_cov_1.822213_6_plen_99_part_00
MLQCPASMAPCGAAVFLLGRLRTPLGTGLRALCCIGVRGRPETAEGPGVVAMGRRARALPSCSPAEGAERPSRLRRVTPPWLPEDYVTQTNVAAVLEQ